MTQLKLLRERRFGPLFWTQFLGALNDNVLKNALVILVTYHATEVAGIPSAQMVSVAGGIFILPFFLFSATAGQLADRFEKTRIIRVIKAAEVGIALLASLGFLTHRPEVLLGALFLMGVHSTFFGPIKFSILPQCLDERELVGGNALVEAGTFLAILLGTLAGGLLTPWQVSTAITLVAILGWAISRRIPAAPPSHTASGKISIAWNPLPPTLEILKFTRSNRTVFLSILGISWFWFFGGVVLSVFPILVRDELRAGESVVTMVLTCFSIGIGVGSLLCETLSRRTLELGLVPLGSLGMSLLTLDLAWTAQGGAWLDGGRQARILVDVVGLAVFCGFYIVPLNALMQQRSDVAHRSRVVAGNNVINAIFMVFSALGCVAGFALGWNASTLLVALAVLNACVAIYIYTLLPEFLWRFVAWTIANVLYRLRVQGDDHLKPNQAAVLVCNHVSFVDWLIIAAGIPRPVRFVMHSSFMRGFLLKWLLRQAGVIPIASARENPEILKRAFEAVAKALQAGEWVCLFPEGEITRDGALAEFKTGVEKMLQTTPAPVHPMALRGLWGSFFSRRHGRAMSKPFRRWWSRVELRVGQALPASAPAAQMRIEVERLLNDTQ